MATGRPIRGQVRIQPGLVVSVLFLALVYLFILLPMVIVIFGSLNSSTSFPSTYSGLTLRWYRSILDHSEFVSAAGTSAMVALVSALLATVLALPATFKIVRSQFRGREALLSFFMMPLIFPQIVLSIATLQMFSLIKVPLSTSILVIAHTVFVFPYVMRALMTSLLRFDVYLEEAAMTLGANRLRTLWRVTLPVMRPGITAGLVLGFVMSFINVPLSLFLATPTSPMLPIRVLSYMESRIDPLVAAIGVVVMVIAFGISLFMERVLHLRLLV